MSATATILHADVDAFYASVVVEARISAGYSAASKAVFAVSDDTSPLVEGLSIDERFPTSAACSG